MDAETTFELAELSDVADVSPRTVRYYIQQGLLPAPDTRGPGARYGAEHLDRLRLIKRLQREHLPLSEIRRRLAGLSAADLRNLAAVEEKAPRTSARDYVRTVLSEGAPTLIPRHAALAHVSAPAMSSAPSPGMSPNRSQWDRLSLTPDIELHVRRPLSREQNRQVERLIAAAHDIFQEDTP